VFWLAECKRLCPAAAMHMVEPDRNDSGDSRSSHAEGKDACIPEVPCVFPFSTSCRGVCRRAMGMWQELHHFFPKYQIHCLFVRLGFTIITPYHHLSPHQYILSQGFIAPLIVSQYRPLMLKQFVLVPVSWVSLKYIHG
jgi:hypothetical protein